MSATFLALVLVLGFSGPCDKLLRLVDEAAGGFVHWVDVDIAVLDDSSRPDVPDGQPALLAAGVLRNDEAPAALLVAAPALGAEASWEHFVEECTLSEAENGHWLRVDTARLSVGKDKGVFFEEAYMREAHPPDGIYWTDESRGVRIELIVKPSVLIDVADRLGLDEPPGLLIRIEAVGT